MKRSIFYISVIFIFFIFTQSLCLAQTRSDQFVTFDSIPDYSCLASEIPLFARASSGLPVTFEVLTNNATIVGDKLRPAAISVENNRIQASIVVRASQTGNAQFNEATPIVRVFRIDALGFNNAVRGLNSYGKNTYCEGESIFFGVESFTGLSAVWTLPDSSTVERFSISYPVATSSLSGVYSFKVKQGVCESFRFNTAVTVFERPSVAWTNKIDSLENDSIPFSLAFSPLGGSLKINNVPTQTWVLNNTISGSYRFEYSFTDANGCSTVFNDSLFLKPKIFLPPPPIPGPIDSNYRVTVYQTVTPNNDGKNDVFFIENIENFTDNTLELYDKWGNRIFLKKSYRNDWPVDEIPNGVYVYKLTIPNHDPKTLIGNLLITK